MEAPLTTRCSCLRSPHTECMQNSKIGKWYERMFEAVGPSSRLP